MRPRHRRLASLCLPLGLALAMVGQFYFAKRREYAWDGVFLYGAALAVLLAAVRLVNSAELPQEALIKRRSQVVAAWIAAHPWRATMAALSVLAALGVGARSGGNLTPAQGLSLLAVWLAAIVLYLAAATDPWAAWRYWRGLLSRHRADPRDLLAAAALLGVALLTRLTALDRIPFVLGGDEASMGLDAVAVLEGRLNNPFATGWFSHPTLFFYLTAAALRCAGATIAGLRLVPALAGALTVPALYLLGRELFDRRVALISAAYLAVYHYAVHYSRLGLNNMVDPLLAVLAVYLLFGGLRTRRPERFALAGVLLGLGQYFYMGSRAMPLALGAFVAWVAWREPGFWRSHRGLFGALAGGFVLTGWPLFVFFARHPNDFMARVTQLGIFQSGWLAQASQLFQRSQASLLWEQVAKSALAFHVYPDPGPFYNPGIPLLDFLSAVPFTLGLVYGLVHCGERRHAVIAFWFWAVLILGGMLLENPPSSQRLVLTTVPASLFVGLGISLIVHVAQEAYRWRTTSAWIAVGLVTALLAAVNLRFYFGTYTAARIYGGINTEVGHAIGVYLRSLGSGYRYEFFGAPRMYAGFANVAYLAPGVEGEDVLEPLTGPPTFVRPDRRPVFVFLPERLGELEAVRLSYPQGQVSEFRRPSGEMLFAAYEPREGSDEPHD